MVGLLSGLLSCFKPTPQATTGTLPGCKFCHAKVEDGFNITYEDDVYIAFEDRSPASEHHYLVIPKNHIESVRSFSTKEDAEVVREMQRVGHSVLDKFSVPQDKRKMGFHIPPFNSVYHLHLHVQGLPYLNNSKAAKYPVAKGFGSYSKGLSWFAEVNQTIEVLEKGRRVGVLPC